MRSCDSRYGREACTFARPFSIAVSIVIGAFCLFGCEQKSANYDWDLPPGFPEPRVPEDNPMSDAKVELGRHLFYDTRLSENQTQSCASCHQQALAFTDGLAQALGSTGQMHPRGSMGLANIAYASTLTWANPVLVRLEQQAPIPIFGEDPIELGLANQEDLLLARLREDADYLDMFVESFPDADAHITLGQITFALGSISTHVDFGKLKSGPICAGRCFSVE